MVRWTLPACPAGHSLPVPAGCSLAVRAAPPSSPFCREESGRRPQKRLPASTTNNGKEDGRRCGTSSLERQCGLGELSRSSALRRSPRRSWQDGAVRPRGSPGDPLVWVPSSAVGGRAPSRPSPGLRPARGLSGDRRRTAAALSFRGQRQGTSPAQGRGHRTAVRTTSPTTALSLSELVWVAPVFKNPPCPRAADTRPSCFHQEPDSAPRSLLTAAPASAPTARPLPPHRGSGCGFPQLAVTFQLSDVKGTFPSDLAAFLRCFPLGAAAPLPHFSCSNF